MGAISVRVSVCVCVCVCVYLRGVTKYVNGQLNGNENTRNRKKRNTKNVQNNHTTCVQKHRETGWVSQLDVSLAPHTHTRKQFHE